jgi:hypothetical protein
VLSRTTLSYRSRNSSRNSRPLILLQTLCRYEKSQVLCNQANPDSFPKIPGCGVGHPERNYWTPGVGYTLASRPCGISNIQTLSSRPSYNLVNASAADSPFVFITIQIPLPATPFVSHPYKTPGGVTLRALCAPTSMPSVLSPFLTLRAGQAPPTPFRINTCKSVSKQMTLTSFRITTYEKPRGEGYTHRLRVLRAPTSVPSVLSPFLPLPTFQIVRCTTIAEWRKIGFRAALRRNQRSLGARACRKRNGIQFRIRG